MTDLFRSMMGRKVNALLCDFYQIDLISKDKLEQHQNSTSQMSI